MTASQRKALNNLMILCTGLPAIWLSQIAPPDLAKYACLFALVGQPFWILATMKSRDWGMFGITLCYTAAWLAGLVRYWILPALGL